MEQVLANALVAAASIVLVAVGFSLIYEGARFFHFAHAASFTWGSYAYLVASEYQRIPAVLGVAIAMIVAGLVGAGMEIAIYRPLRRRGASSLVLLLASVGLMIVAQATIALTFGSEVRLVHSAAGGVYILGISLTWAQVATGAAALVTLGGLIGLGHLHLLGSQFRAVASDQLLAEVIGVPTERLLVGLFALGSALAGLAGVLQGMDFHLRPTMGLRPLLLGVVAMVIGGSGNLGGIALGAIILAGLQQWGAWWFGSEWQDAVAVAVLLVFLLVRPQGILGRRVRSVTV